MAITTLCAKLVSGHGASCESPSGRYYQQAVIINHSSIDPESVVITAPTGADGEACSYNATFDLKAGETGYLFIGPQSGSNFFGTFDKSRNAYGFPTYSHSVQVLLTGASEDAKCIIEALDKGSFVVALQLTDGTVEIYGLQNGLTTGDYTYNLQEGGGGAPVVLSSLEGAAESRLPLVYKSGTPGNETIDFDALFAVPAA